MWVCTHSNKLINLDYCVAIEVRELEQEQVAIVARLTDQEHEERLASGERSKMEQALRLIYDSLNQPSPNTALVDLCKI